MALKFTAIVIEIGKLRKATPNNLFRQMISTCENPKDSWNGTCIAKNGHGTHAQRAVRNTDRRKTNIYLEYEWTPSEEITHCMGESVDNKAERNTARGIFVISRLKTL
ncbi:hypothetical protein TNIN_367301 [Trichonephila inaurata madagascariensis]|uniref:Uncharacterized protein n=1 Tax=Trichonephila inaurata madagascariensis TaxID=2747483 RepID=A0A8X6XJD2_9ARAC|nr:hypothetical protein TNIN_367301 [Trichonephila inaurata madagascariensis]